MNQGPIRYVLLSAVTTGISQYIPGGFSDCTFYFTGSGTLSGGTVVIEEADWPLELSGTMPGGAWSQVTSLAPTGFTGGAQQAVHLPKGCYAAVRVNISSPLTGGGTATITARAQY